VTRDRLAWASLAAGQVDRAIEVYEQVLAAQQRVITADHPDTLITTYGLASAYEQAGRIAEASALYQLVAERYEAALGPGQELTVKAQHALARLQAR